MRDPYVKAWSLDVIAVSGHPALQDPKIKQTTAERGRICCPDLPQRSQQRHTSTCLKSRTLVQIAAKDGACLFDMYTPYKAMIATL